MSFPLSVLDLSPVSSGSTSAQALRNSIALAQVVDRLGYTRYWFAEHHNMPSIASSVPEIMIGQVARETTHLRVGSGGVMLPNHPPLKIAETFRMLEALYPGRIDLGIGRAPGTDPLTAFALRRNKDALHANDFPDHLSELMAFAADDFPSEHPFRAITAMPNDVGFPTIWLLGSSATGSQMAASLGVGYAFAHHINPENAVAALRGYREHFKPSKYLDRPYSILTVALICAETTKEAERLASSVALSIVRLRNGQPLPFPSPEEAAAYPYTPAERAQAEAYRKSTQIVGDPATVRSQLDRLVAVTGADEVMVATLIHSHEARVRSYELLAEVYGLEPVGA
ncbi:MAG: LLM class flavin-dependent oxidoreductase [Caldilineaceae bacterium]|nr:LLM class flavin-dependent oxidoreductase [Caldilineaceae bacterium]